MYLKSLSCSSAHAEVSAERAAPPTRPSPPPSRKVSLGPSRSGGNFDRIREVNSWFAGKVVLTLKAAQHTS